MVGQPRCPARRPSSSGCCRGAFFDQSPRRNENKSYARPAIYSQRAQSASYFQSEIRRSFNNYILACGYPLSIIDLATRGEITQGTYVTYQQALLGDITKAGKHEARLRELIGAILAKDGEPITWQILQQMTSIGSHNTVEDYIRTLEALYVVAIVHQVRSLGGAEISFRKRKKLYFIDPFQCHCLGSWSAGYSTYFDFAQRTAEDPLRLSRVVEGITAAHLMQYCRKCRTNVFQEPSEEPC